MNINYKQPQFELFPANTATLEDVNKPRFFLANLTLSLESLVILSILIIMVGLFAFSLGVERGKHLTAQALDERVSAAWNLAPKKPALPVAVKAVPVAAVHAPVVVKSMTAKAPVSAKAGSSMATKAVVTAPVVATTGRFTLQVGSYKNGEFAKDQVKAFKQKKVASFLIKNGDFWLVCIGQFSDATSAQNAFKKLKPKFPGLVVRKF